MAIIILIVSSLFYISQGRKKETSHEKILMYGFAVFWLSIALVRAFFYFSDYILEGTYTGDLNEIILSFDITSYILLYFYLYFFIYIFISIISVNLMFIWFSIKAKKEIQAISSVVAIGLTVVLIGWAFETITIKELNLISPTFPPIFVIVGVIIAILPLILNLEFFSKALANWLVILSIVFILVFLSLTVFTNLPLFIISQVIIWISSFVLVLVIIYIIFYLVKRVRTPETSLEDKKGELKDFIRIFTKPLDFSMKEIKFYRDRGLCLVCKNKISGLTYVCPNCDAWYCIKCSKALTELENVCWGCGKPINLFKLLKYEEEHSKKIKKEKNN
ncbi:MAG: hypothetical protein ACFE8M_04405 [Candidatus Hermodarchaeota archaeon]